MFAMDKALPSVFVVDQNYPNPFNPVTTIKFALPAEERVDISVYSLRGEKVTTLVSRVYGPGHHEVVWNAKGVASGAYFYRVTTGSEVVTKRMMLVK